MITELSTAVPLSEALRSAVETRSVNIARGILSRAPHLFGEQFGNRPAMIIADHNTFAAAGEAVVAAFQSAGHTCLEPFIFHEANLYAEHGCVAQLESKLKPYDAIPVAVGAGTINDLTKLAA